MNLTIKPRPWTGKLEAGFYEASTAEYLGIPAASRSILHTLLSECPAAARLKDGEGLDPSPALDIGDALHRMVFEGATLRSFVVADAGVTRRQKQWDPLAFSARAAGRVPLTADEAQVVYEMHRRVTESPAGLSLINQPKALREVTAVWSDEETGVWCRAKLDLLSLTAPGYILDLKSTSNADPRRFSYSCRDYGYTMQVGMYLAGVEALLGPDAVRGFIIVAVEKEPPYRIEWYDMEAHIEAGRKQFREALRVYAQCQATGDWPASAREPGAPFALTPLPLL